MDGFNGFFNSVSDRIIGIFSALGPLWALVVISVLFGIAVAILFRYTSNQDALKRASDQSKAAVLAIRLFPKGLGNMFGSLARLFWHSGRRIMHTLPVLLIVLIPTTILLVQLAAWYEFRPLGIGDSAIVEVNVADGTDAWDATENLELVVPRGIVLETPALRDVAEKTLYWRIGIEADGEHLLTFESGEGSFQKEITAGEDAFAPVSPQRAGAADTMSRILFPREAALPTATFIKGIHVHFPPRSTPLFGWDIPWWATLLIVSILGALAVKPFLGVHF